MSLEETMTTEYIDKMAKFVMLIEEEDILGITLALHKDISIDAVYENTSVLEHAIAFCSDDILEILLYHQPNVNYVNKHNVSLLDVASELKAYRKMELLLRAGADPNRSSTLGATPLKMMINSNGQESKYIPHIQLLLENGADPNFVDKRGSSPLKLALEKGSIEAVTLLMKHGANPMLEREPNKIVRDLKIFYDIDYNVPTLHDHEDTLDYKGR